MKIAGQRIKAVIDTGAASNVISNTLATKLGLEIQESSNIIFKIANGKKVPALGTIKVNIEIQDKNIPIRLQVIDSKVETLLLGTEWFAKEKAKINFEKKIL